MNYTVLQLGNHLSKTFEIDMLWLLYGVSQGYVFGPFLIDKYHNDIIKTVSYVTLGIIIRMILLHVQV